MRRYDKIWYLKNNEIILLFKNQNPSKNCMHVIFLSVCREFTSVVNIWKLFFKRPAIIAFNATEHMHMNQLYIYSNNRASESRCYKFYCMSLSEMER